MKRNYFLVWNHRYMTRLDKKEESILRPALEYHHDHTLRKFFIIWKTQYTKSKVEHVSINYIYISKRINIICI